MNIDELLNDMEEMLEEAVNLPFTGGKRAVDVERIRDCIDDIRLNLPTEIKQAKAIVNDRADLVAGAKREAEAIVKKAEDRARIMVSESEIIKASQQKSAEIMTVTQQQAREMRKSVTDYCENMLHQTEEQLARSANDVKTVRMNLRKGTRR